METKITKGIGCKACSYQGYFVEDFNDPQDPLGHGQREYACELCEKGGIVMIWERLKERLSETQQVRIRRRVLEEGMDFMRAIENEGIITVETDHDMSVAAELFADDTLHIGDASRTGAEAIAQEAAEAKVAGGFIPRPKP